MIFRMCVCLVVYSACMSTSGVQDYEVFWQVQLCEVTKCVCLSVSSASSSE